MRHRPSSGQLLQPKRLNRQSFRVKVLNTWYVVFSEHHVMVMRIVKDRREAIALACDMLDRRIEVTGAGPMLETGKQQIDSATIREIWRDRARDNRGAVHALVVGDCSLVRRGAG